MARRLFSGLHWAGLLAIGSSWGCEMMRNQPAAYAPTGGPAAAQGSTSRMANVPYCPGGKRDKGCLFGTDCRVTEQGCQVCQCEGLDD